MASDFDMNDADVLSTVSVDGQIKIVSWFLHQEGSVLPEIVSRLSAVYGAETIDIISVSLFLQGIKSTAKQVEQQTETVSLEDIEESSLIDALPNNTEEYKVLDDILNGNDDRFQSMLTEEPKLEKRPFRSRKKVMCTFCNKIHVNKYTLDSHIATHHPSSARSCRICGKVYGLTELLNKHIRVKHDSSERVELEDPDASKDNPKKLGWKCSDCGKVFKSKKALETHSYVHLKQNDLSCEICGKTLRNPVTLLRHKANFHGESAEFMCQICDEKFSSKITLKQHLGTHGFLCKTCCEVFQSAPELEQHSRLHEKKFRCDICHNRFSSEVALKMHIKRLHFKEDIHSCVKCGEQFLSRLDLKSHASAIHGKEVKPMFVCDTCGKPYASTTKLKNHILYDHQQLEKPYQCDICHKRFAYKPDQLRHMERHDSEPKYNCGECQKKFFTKNDMQRHFKVVHEKYHAGSCEVCGRRFQTVGGREWTQHMNSHAGIKDISCPLCSKTFFTDETLKCHMISHFDTMYWSCAICCKNFKRIKNVKYHLRAAHSLTDKDEIRKQCVKLRNAPTKAEIQQMCESRSCANEVVQPAEGKTDFVLPDFKHGITATFELTL